MRTAIFMMYLFTVSGFSPSVENSQEIAFPWKSYEEMRAQVGKLYQQQKYSEMAAILERALERFPDHWRSNTFNLALAYVRLGNPEKGLLALRKGLDRGIWYGKYDFLGDMWTPLKKLDQFAEIERLNEAHRLEAQRQVKPRLDVVTPEGYVATGKYPLFIALHGGGENVDVFKPKWTSELLRKKYIVAYPQSTLLIAPDGYNWTEDIPRSLAEIRQVYDKIVREYAVDAGKVVVGGFSSGGVAALDVVLNKTFPVAGFVVLCPAKPDDLTPDKVAAAADRGVRGTLLTTEMDGRLGAQKEMAELLTKHGLLQEFIITPNLGHWYPDDLAQKIDLAVTRIIN
jgi:predicted esterase